MAGRAGVDTAFSLPWSPRRAFLDSRAGGLRTAPESLDPDLGTPSPEEGGAPVRHRGMIPARPWWSPADRSSLDAGSGAPDERLDLGQAGHRGVSWRRHGQGAMGRAVLEARTRVPLL